MEADRFRSTEEARKIWADILAVLGDFSRFWVELIQVKRKNWSQSYVRLFNLQLQRQRCRRLERFSK
jgi:hypothetical protein